jgi:hypothetical protein
VEALLATHHRLAADGYDSTADDSRSPAVATCRQTVDALLATHHRLAADGYDSTADDSRSPAVGTCRQTVEALLAHPPPLGSGWLRFGSGWLRFGNQPGWAKPWIVHGWQIKTADLREINGEAITSRKSHKGARPITFICVQRIEFDR